VLNLPFQGWLLPFVQRVSECFSFGGLADLKDVDGFGELPGAPGAAAEFAQDPPGLELGVGPLAGSAEPGVGAVGLFLRGGLAPFPVRRAYRITGPM
jgi:hypothetical protein